MQAPRVAKSDWLHGLARCPSCGLSLDAEKDVDKRLYRGLQMEWTGVEGTHRRCGGRFTFEFGKLPK